MGQVAFFKTMRHNIQSCWKTRYVNRMTDAAQSFIIHITAERGYAERINSITMHE